ncbi:beta-lactamase/transpeptidase-like protein [Pyrenochaeta sp. DS3sAY3a]|nr:beta-lactamase/transpeptidase-like protein [Pyrenochaeta sp. DS3sAY3a]
MSTTTTTTTATKSLGNDPRVLAALEESIKAGETGVSVAVYQRGELIIDAHAGIANPATSLPVTASTLFPVFSVTKGVTALAVHIQVERGLVDLNAPIAKYWPEFAVNGKDKITITQALSHRAGIPQMPQGVTPELMANWDWMVQQIANYSPVFPPGTVNAYHVLVWGWIIGEVVVRTDPAHRPFDKFVYEEICEPLGVTDFYLGVPETELGRVATLSGGNSAPLIDNYNICPPEVFCGSNVHNLKVVQKCVDPGAGAITTAAAVAKIFALFAEGGELDGVRLLSKDRVATFTEPREDAHDQDKIVAIPTWFGAAGFYLGGEAGSSVPLVPNHRRVIYSPGAGGSYAWADLKDRVAVAICHNNMDAGIIHDPEMTFMPIVRAIQEVLSDNP